MKEIFVKGYFRKNLGDDLFVKVIIERYKYNSVLFKMHSILNYKNVYNQENIKIYSLFYIGFIIKFILNNILKILKLKRRYNVENFIKYDVLVLLSGSYFMEQKEFSPKFYYKNNFKNTKDIYILGVNFGPYETKEYLNIHKNLIFKNAVDVCFRDKYSYNLFKELDNVRYAPDIIFSLDISKIKIKNSKRVIISVINCKKDDMNFIEQDLYNQKICEFINFFEKKNYKITLISFSKEQGDEKVINEIIKKCKNKNISKYFYRGNIDETLNVIGDSNIVVGTRFHANILGLIMNKTIIPIIYSDKTLNVLNDIKFKGKIFDIRKMEQFDINSITDEELNYKLDVSKQKKDAEKHFKELDKILKH